MNNLIIVPPVLYSGIKKIVYNFNCPNLKKIIKKEQILFIKRYFDIDISTLEDTFISILLSFYYPCNKIKTLHYSNYYYYYYIDKPSSFNEDEYVDDFYYIFDNLSYLVKKSYFIKNDNILNIIKNEIRYSLLFIKNKGQIKLNKYIYFLNKENYILVKDFTIEDLKKHPLLNKEEITNVITKNEIITKEYDNFCIKNYITNIFYTEPKIKFYAPYKLIEDFGIIKYT